MPAARAHAGRGTELIPQTRDGSVNLQGRGFEDRPYSRDLRVHRFDEGTVLPPLAEHAAIIFVAGDHGKCAAANSVIERASAQDARSGTLDLGSRRARLPDRAPDAPIVRQLGADRGTPHPTGTDRHRTAHLASEGPPRAQQDSLL